MRLSCTKAFRLYSRKFDRRQIEFLRRFRILGTYDDDCTRECLTAVVDVLLSGRRGARERDLLITARGKPKTIVSDNGTELTSDAILSSDVS